MICLRNTDCRISLYKCIPFNRTITIIKMDDTIVSYQGRIYSSKNVSQRLLAYIRVLAAEDQLQYVKRQSYWRIIAYILYFCDLESLLSFRGTCKELCECVNYNLPALWEWQNTLPCKFIPYTIDEYIWLCRHNTYEEYNFFQRRLVFHEQKRKSRRMPLQDFIFCLFALEFLTYLLQGVAIPF